MPLALVDEAWSARRGPLKPLERQVNSQFAPKRLVLLIGRAKSGEPFGFFAEIIRDGEKVLLGDTEVWE